jgi:hypothetical protein
MEAKLTFGRGWRAMRFMERYVNIYKIICLDLGENPYLHVLVQERRSTSRIYLRRKKKSKYKLSVEINPPSVALAPDRG